MRLDIADLQLFLRIVDAGSISQGAVHANLALASASERVRHIEDAAGMALLHRHARGVTPTEAGEALAHHARRILQQQAQLRDELRDFATGARGTLHLYANTAALAWFLPPRLAPWLAQRPRLHVALKERTSTEIVRLIGAGLAEAGIVSDAVDAQGLALQPIARDHLMLIAPADHPIARQRSISLADVLDQPFVGLADGNALQDHIDERAGAAGQALAWRIRMKTFAGLGEMVAHGVGLGIVPQDIARRQQRRYGYRSIALTDGWARRQLCLCVRDWGALSPPMLSLLTHLGAKNNNSDPSGY